MADELKDQRVPIMMSPSELKALDDWMFANRIRSRGEAIRRLCQVGLLANGKFFEMQDRARRRSRYTTEAIEEIEKAISAEAPAKHLTVLVKKMQLSLVRYSIEELEDLIELNAEMASMTHGRDVQVGMEHINRLRDEIAALRKEGPLDERANAVFQRHFEDLFGPLPPSDKGSPTSEGDEK